MNISMWSKWLIPDQPRRFVGQRWLNIALRSLHLLGIAGVAGGFLFAVEAEQWQRFWQLSLLTGFALMALYVWATARWLVQLKGVVILLKLLLLWWASNSVEWQAELFMLVIVLSAVIAHAPGEIRGYMLLGKNPNGGCS